MGNVKPWWQSRIIWVSIVTVIFAVLGATGFLPEGLTEEGVVEAIMGIIGVLIVILRVGTTDTIGKNSN